MNGKDAVILYRNGFELAMRRTVRVARVVAGVALVVVLAACAGPATRQSVESSIAAEMVAPTLERARADDQPIEMDAERHKLPPPVEPQIERGTGKFINEKAARAPVGSAEAPKGQVVFNFENQPIQSVVKAILGDLLKKNYIIAPGVAGNVSYATAQPVRIEDAMPILETLLAWTNNTLIFTEGRYTVLPTKDAIPGNLTPRLAPAQMAKGYQVRIFPLRYISPSEMQKLIKPFAQADAFISVDTARSMLILAGTPDQLANYQQTIDIFDVDWLKGMSIGVYNLQSQEVEKVMAQLELIFGTKGESPLAGMFRFVPVEATNSIIVITSQPEYLTRAQEWLLRLDAGATAEAGAQIYIYDVLNVKAADLAGYLNEIFNGFAPSRATDTGGAVAPGLTPVDASGSSPGTGPGGISTTTRASRRAARSNNAAPASAGAMPSDGGPRITSVDENNQLLVLSSPAQWAIIQQAARRLDIAPLQVQVEAKVLEVQLIGNFKFGVQWYLEGLIGSEAAGGQPGRAQPGNQQAWALGGMSPAAPMKDSTFFYSFVNSELQVALNAMETSGNSKILSAPSVVVLNNQQASINVGDQVPTSQTYTVSGMGIPGTSGNYGTGMVTYRDTGIKLDVVPRVNPGGLVYLDIEQEVSKLGPKSEADPAGNRPISRRTIVTQVAVQSGETVLLGGLIQENESDSEGGVPFLHRIPVIGRMFGTTERGRDRTELIVLITPRVIYNSRDAREITREYQLRFESLKPLRTRLESKPEAAETAPLPAAPREGETP